MDQPAPPFKPPDYWGHRQRVRERYLKSGLDGWQDYEVLEFALFYAIPKRDTKPLAKELLRRFGSLQSVVEAPVRDLVQVPGVGLHTALMLRFMRDMARVYLRNRMHSPAVLDSPQAVHDYACASLKGLSDESLLVIALNSANAVADSTILQRGTVDHAPVYPRKILEYAITRKAVGLIMAHNHPGGGLQPSRQDLEITRAVRQALELVGVKLLDHLIVGRDGFASLASQGLL